jgi:purine nucleosidase
MAERIILDCDPGHDDAVAILLAVGSPSIDLLGVTTVGGNQSLEKVTFNARAVLEMAHATDIEVRAGCDRPIVRPQEVAASIHGESGLDGVVLPEPTRPLDAGHAVNWIVDTIMSNEPGTITLVPTGPLTNIAMAVRMEPRIVERVKQVVLMGGGVYEGNWSAVAEFNIKVDPEAAHIVFNEAWPITMVGLDATHKALCTPAVQQRIEQVGGELGVFVSRLMDFFRKTYQDNQDFVDPPVHDPCTVAYLIDPAVLTVRKAPVTVEISDGPALGMTIADMRGPEDPSCHTQVALGLDFDRFWGIVENAIENIAATNAR